MVLTGGKGGMERYGRYGRGKVDEYSAESRLRCRILRGYGCSLFGAETVPKYIRCR